MKVSGCNLSKTKKIVNVNSGENKQVETTNENTDTTELLMKYYSLKNIITVLNDDIKTIRNQSLNFVNIGMLKDYNDTISSQLSDLIVHNTPRDNSNTINALVDDLEKIKKMLETKQEGQKEEEDDRYENVVATIELLSEDIKKLSDRLDDIEAKQQQKTNIPRLVLKSKNKT